MEYIPLPIHLFIHFALAIAVGYVVGRAFKKPELGIMFGILGGFFIDLDHVLEYFLVFGLRFNIFDFLDGRQFLASGLVRSWFHAWEYIPGLLLVAWLVRKNKTAVTVILALTLGGAVHLATDSLINNYPLRNYSLVYRYQVDFQAERLLNSEQYQEFMENKLKLSL